MKTVRFHNYGEPTDVLRFEDASVPSPVSNQIRVRVHACGLNPADWALCRGLFAGNLPRGIGLEASGIIDAVGAGVTDVGVGQAVLGTPDFAGFATAGASDYDIFNHWTEVPSGLKFNEAAALPMAVETAYRSLDNLQVTAQHTLLVRGAGTTVGFAAVQMALMRGVRVIATAGHTFADRLRVFGATVTPYGEGMVDRVLQLAQGAPDFVLDTSPANGALPDLIKIAGGNPRLVLTISDFEAAAKLGTRDTGRESNARLRYDVLGQFAKLAAERHFTVPVSGVYRLEEWRAAVAVSQSGKAHGKLILTTGL